jgi:hypothetical protein
MGLKLWLISQSANDGYDTYDSAVVVAADAEEARRVHPSPYRKWIDDVLHFAYSDGSTTKETTISNCWAESLDQIEVEAIGIAAPGLSDGTVICASFNAG